MSPPILARARKVALGGAAVTALATGAVYGWSFGAGVAAAGLWAVASLRTLEGLMNAAVVAAGRTRDGRAVFGWATAKIGVYVLAIWALIVRPFPTASLLVGLTWLPIALVAAGLLPAPHQDPDATPRG